jgi:RHS repeat-associated protein
VVHSQQKGGNNAQTTVTISRMQYDALNRLTGTTKQVQNSLVNNNAVSGVVNIATQQYDALGQLSTKQLGNTKNSSGYTANPLETLAYDYNIRGWLLGINRSYVRNLSTASTFLGEGFTTPASYSAGNYFGFELGYDKAPTVGAAAWGSAANYNGNITGMIWKSVHDGQIRKYNFSYDAVNRLAAANFTQYYNSSFNDSSGVNYTTNNLSYDANGNILSMNQYGLKTPVATSSVLIDQLSYTYLPGSNKLQRVTDAANDSSSVLGDFKYLQSAKSDTDYVYDLNGNVIADKNKNISNIAYNILNLPQTITVAGKGTITYTYDAAGNKLRKQTVEGTKTTTTLYAGGIVYENDTLRFIPHEEGRTRINNNTNYVFDYYLKDHLGNVRMTITDDTTQPIPVIDATSYYPFGLTMSGVSSRAAGKLENKFKYNGKELQSKEFSDGLGTEWYDYAARMYDNQIGRFFTVDPAINNYKSFSGYIYGADNPIRFIDIYGLGPGDRIKKAESFIHTKYSQKAGLNTGKELRTGNSQAALNYIDCSELVCRTIAADGITKNVGQMATGDLGNFLSDDDKFITSKDEPKAGDIFLWRSDGQGHTGIVEKVDDDGIIHTIEAYGTKEGTDRFERKLSQFTNHKGWKGFFRPVIETPDGKLDEKKNDKKDEKKAIEPIKVTVKNGNTTTQTTLDNNTINSWNDFVRELNRWFNWQ